MASSILTLQKMLQVGLRSNFRAGINLEFLLQLENRRPTEFGLRMFKPIDPLYAIDVVGSPFPQIFRGKKHTWLLASDSLSLVDESDWSLTAQSLITDLAGSAAAIDAGGPWHMVDLRETMMFFNGIGMIFTAPLVQSTLTMGRDWVWVPAEDWAVQTGNEFKNGQVFMAGFDRTNFWRQLWRDYIAFLTESPEIDLSDEVKALIDMESGADTNWVLWTPIGSGLFMHLLPEYYLPNPNATARPTSYQTESLLSNGDFETDLTDWSGADWIWSAVYNGSLLNDSSAVAVTQAEADMVSLPIPGQFYEVLFYMHVASTGLRIRLGTNTPTGDPIFQSVGWHRAVVKADTSANDLFFLPVSAGVHCIDQISMRQATVRLGETISAVQQTANQNVVANPNFDLGTNGWDVGSTPWAVETDPVTGENWIVFKGDTSEKLIQLFSQMQRAPAAGEIWDLAFTMECEVIQNILDMSALETVDTDTGWNTSDGVTSWFLAQRDNLIQNSRFYLGGAGGATGYQGWSLGTGWAHEALGGPGTHGMRHTPGDALEMVQFSSQMWFNGIELDVVYDCYVRIMDWTAGTLTVRLGQDGIASSMKLIDDPGPDVGTIFTLQRDPAATDETTLYLYPSSDFDGLVKVVQVQDPDIDEASDRRVFESADIPNGNLKQIGADLLLPLEDTRRYVVSFFVRENTHGQKVRPILGGNNVRDDGSGFLGVGQHDVLMEAGAGADVEFELEDAAANEIRLYDVAVRPETSVDFGFRPVIGGRVYTPKDFDPAATTNYFQRVPGPLNFVWLNVLNNNPVRVGESDFQLAFEIGPETNPDTSRIRNVALARNFFSSGNVVVKRALINDYMRRNDFGMVPMDWQGTVLRTAQLGDHEVIYGTDGVTCMRHYADPGVWAPYKVPGLQKHVGVAGRGAVGISPDRHVWIDSEGKLMAIDSDLKVFDLGYQEIFQPWLGQTITISHDSSLDEFHICRWQTGNFDVYILTKTGLGRGGILPTSLEFVQGGLAAGAVQQSTAITDTSVNILTNVFRGPGIGVHEIEHVQVVGYRDPGEAMDLYVDARMSPAQDFQRLGPFEEDARGVYLPKVSGVEFRLFFQGENGITAEHDAYLVQMTDEGKRSHDKWLTVT